MPGKCRYGFGTEVELGFDATVAKIEELLNNHGFRIWTRLRVDEIMCKDLQESFGRYVILGACNPEFAAMIFKADPDIGLLMPCNVIVYELPAGGCRVMIKDPLRIMDVLDAPEAIEGAIKIKEQLETVIEELGRQ